MATVIVDFTAFPQSVAVDASQLTQLNDGTWRQTYTPTQSSASLATGGNYYCLAAGNDLGGLWMYDDGGTLKVALFQNVSGSPIIVETAIVRAAGTAFTALIDNVADNLNLSGAGLTTGAGDHAFTGSTTGDAFGTSPIGSGQYPGGGYTWPGAASDIDDGVDAVVRTAAGTTAIDAATAAARTPVRSGAGVTSLAVAVDAARSLVRSAAGATAIAVATAADVAGSIVRSAAGVTGIDIATAAVRALNRSAAGSSALGAATAATRALIRSAAGTSAIGASTAATVPGSAMALGGYGAARVLYGTAAGTVSVTITTAATGSTFLLAVGGNLSDLATAPTDSEGNTWTQVGSFEFTQWSGYGCVYYQCVNATGAGGSHTFSQQFGQTLGFDECSIAVVEIENAIHVEDSAVTETASGSTVNTPAVVSQDACEWVVFSTGDAPTGSTAAYSPSNGLTVIEDSTGVDHPNGYVPIVILHASKAVAGSYSSAIGITPSQRLGLGVFAVQAANVIVRQAAGTTGLGAATAASRVLNRQAAGVSALGVATAAGRASTRTAAGETALGAATAATRAVQRTAAGATAISAATAAARALVRSAPGSTALGVATTAARALARTGAGTTAIGVATAALRALQRTAAGASAIDVATAATHEPAGTHIRSAAGFTGIDVATAAARTVARVAAGITGLDVVTAAVRALVRQASGVTAINASTSASASGSAIPFPSPGSITWVDLSDAPLTFEDL